MQISLSRIRRPLQLDTLPPESGWGPGPREAGCRHEQLAHGTFLLVLTNRGSRHLENGCNFSKNLGSYSFSH